MKLRVACLTVALTLTLTLTLGACWPTADDPDDASCTVSLANASGEGFDDAAFSYADGCVRIEDLQQRGFRVVFGEGGPLSSISISGRNVEDLDLNTVGEYECDQTSADLTAVGIASDSDNPAYGNGACVSYNQNTAVEGDCLHGSCSVSVTSPASSGTLKVHFTGNLGRSKAGAAFHCDYMSFGFDLAIKTDGALD